ncbi:MAG: hypothetical protein ABFQ62_03725 [Patescibacteria group bacterium]
MNRKKYLLVFISIVSVVILFFVSSVYFKDRRVDSNQLTSNFEFVEGCDTDWMFGSNPKYFDEEFDLVEHKCVMGIIDDTKPFLIVLFKISLDENMHYLVRSFVYENGNLVEVSSELEEDTLLNYELNKRDGSVLVFKEDDLVKIGHLNHKLQPYGVEWTYY